MQTHDLGLRESGDAFQCRIAALHIALQIIGEDAVRLVIEKRLVPLGQGQMVFGVTMAQQHQRGQGRATLKASEVRFGGRGRITVVGGEGAQQLPPHGKYRY